MIILDIVVQIGKTIRKRRESLGLSLEKAAELSGISTNHMGSIERADSIAKIDTLYSIATALGIDWTKLMQGQDSCASEQKIPLTDNFDSDDIQLFNSFVKEFVLWKAKKKQ